MANVPTVFIYTPAASQTIGCPSGNVYSSDVYQLIYNVAPADVPFLLSIGCIWLNQRNNVSVAQPTSDDDQTDLYGILSLIHI